MTDIARVAGATSPTTQAAVSGVSLSSLAVQPGDLYAALPGANAHGAQFVVQAAAAGAAAVLTDERGARLVHESGVDLPTIVVEDPRAILGAVAAIVYGTALPAGPGIRAVGITGTNGKTTTAYLLTSALEAMGRRAGLIGTVETRVGADRVPSARTTPESPDLHALLRVMSDRAVQDCVMEVSSHALVLHRVDEVVFDIALFTNLSQDHLDFHADMEDYFAAKASLFTPARSRQGVVCVDDTWGARLAEQAEVPVVTLASTSDTPADVVLTEVDGSDFRLVGEVAGTAVDLALRSHLPGSFNRTNTAMAATALLLAGHDPETVGAAVLERPVVPGRMELVPAPESSSGEDLPTVVVDFAHTPDAVASALAALREDAGGALVAVIGAGGSRDPGKRPAMGAAAAAHADLVVVTDDNPRAESPEAIRAALVDGARRGPGEVVEVAGRRAAIAHALRAARPGGTVALLGKGHESGQEIDGVTTPFDDRQVAADELVELIRETGS
ncbi:UDP-N-acetylmuramoyl-L-alanyl-D-glutamate--2,6-diaminopimelate ligase [Marihabitans asiaticum]|uniref:UDP-N-acetylmuramoyl-L-alanyl-D-glutamate--2, 6-diaminopimelate ligase n=1 Tax=Marihabitans asiaticum TaxID=415218 RepID=UPI001FE7281A|nr:UDP-N-acetylmuramoyl-L-alanyl-D-glutamate--2,6-diaminopimelate ligase [Marihabitans asiaticum]